MQVYVVRDYEYDINLTGSGLVINSSSPKDSLKTDHVSWLFTDTIPILQNDFGICLWIDEIEARNNWKNRKREGYIPELFIMNHKQ